MVADPRYAAAWSTTPLTKFRAPRVRREVIARPALLQRLATAIEHQPLTLVCAPGGFGKTSLLSQFAAGFAAPTSRAVLWIALDEDDNDRHRFFGTLLHSVEPLGLTWETPPATLLVNAAGSDSQCRAALAALVNALCTAAAQRVVLVLDDLHRVDRPEVLALLEALIERLPDHVSVVLGTRVEPALPLARWRAHGELAELVPWDLQFTEDEALALAAARGSGSTQPAEVREIWRRMHGWAAGLAMALQSQRGGPVSTAASDATERHLFAYLAQEILADLPEDMREFVLECSVLSEMSPSACEAVSGRGDAQQLLESLYRRNLFVTATDDSLPVLRFHDLFRDFLESELERRHPQRLNELHERAGRAESSLARAIAHFIRAESWNEAMHLIALNGEALLTHGDHAALESWLDQIPDAARRTDARLCYLRGLCAWLRWDWSRARQELEPAVAAMNGPEQAALRIRAMFLLVDAFNSSGSRDRAWQVLEQIDALMPQDSLSRAQLAVQRAWFVALGGDPEGVGNYLTEFIDHAGQDPVQVCPKTADRIHLLVIGLPKVAQCFEKFFALTDLARDGGNAPWQLAALAVGAWGHFWHGRREPVFPILARGDVLHHQFGGIRLISERLLQFRTLFHAANGQFETAAAMSRKLIDALQSPEAIAHRAVWLRAYQHGLARIYWMAGDHEQFRALAPALLTPRLATEWPFIETAIELVRGQVAIVREDWTTAATALTQAIATHERFRMPMIYGNPRVSLAYMHLVRGERDRSWETFEPVWQEVLEDEALGLLLLEPASIVDALLELIPAELRRAGRAHALLSRLAQWRPTLRRAPEPELSKGPLAALSDRERDVLAHVASGAGNKQIARELNLSLHTVKRHIANILDKLDCASRGQAADAFRRAGSGS